MWSPSSSAGGRVWGVTWSSPSPDQEVADQNPALRRVPGGYQRVRPRLVAPGGGNVDPERPHPEDSGLAIEQAAEMLGESKPGTHSAG